MDYLIPNEIELSEIMGKKSDSLCDNDCIKFLKENEIGTLVVTLGSLGCKIFDNVNETVFIKTKEREAVDTTGAGDTFLGAFVTAISERKPIEYAANFANIASGIEVMRPGAQRSMPTREEVEYEYNENFS